MRRFRDVVYISSAVLRAALGQRRLRRVGGYVIHHVIRFVFFIPWGRALGCQISLGGGSQLLICATIGALGERGIVEAFCQAVGHSRSGGGSPFCAFLVVFT